MTETNTSSAADTAAPARFALSRAQVDALLSKTKVTPWVGSPLPALRPVGAPTADVDAPVPVIEAVRRLAQPEMVTGMVVCAPPQPAEFAWYYAAGPSSDHVLYEKSADGDTLLAYPIDARSLVEIAESELDLDAPSAFTAVELTLSAGGLQTLAALADLAQERSLDNLRRREQPDEVLHFDVRQLKGCVDRSLAGSDTRWMTARTVVTAPVQLGFSETELTSGLAELEGLDLVVRHGDEYQAGYATVLLCSRLGVCSGFCSVSSRRRGDDGHWHREHFSVTRGADALWLLEYTGLDDGNWRVIIGDSTPRLVHERIDDALHPGPAVQRRCPVCRAAVYAGRPFCGNCGADLEPEEQAATISSPEPLVPPPAPEPRLHAATRSASSGQCVHCGGALRPGAHFCTHCGAAQDARAAAPQACVRCHAPLEPGAKFCTQCGAPT